VINESHKYIKTVKVDNVLEIILCMWSAAKIGIARTSAKGYSMLERDSQLVDSVTVRTVNGSRILLLLVVALFALSQ
jgi:hypothetical protein